MNYKHFIPKAYVHSIHDIDYAALAKSGKNVILTDLDNTLISYKETEPNPDLFAWLDKVRDLGFSVLIISNSEHKRVSHFASIIQLPFVNSARKPLKKGFKKALDLMGSDGHNAVLLGDQLLTDVWGGNRMGIEVFLVKAIERKSERFVTRVNRRLEKFILNKVKQHHYAHYIEGLIHYEQ